MRIRVNYPGISKTPPGYKRKSQGKDLPSCHCCGVVHAREPSCQGQASLRNASLEGGMLADRGRCPYKTSALPPVKASIALRSPLHAPLFFVAPFHSLFWSLGCFQVSFVLGHSVFLVYGSGRSRIDVQTFSFLLPSFFTSSASSPISQVMDRNIPSASRRKCST